MKQLYTFIFTFISVVSYSQQEPQFSMFWNNYSLFNPANTGLENRHYANATYRTSFQGLGLNPQTVSANYETKLDKYNSGVGLGFVIDNISLLNSNKIYANYAYHLVLKNYSQLSFGIGLDYNTRKFDFNWNPQQPNYPNLPSSNPQGKFDVNLGIVFNAENLKLGLSVTQFNKPLFDELHFTNSRHIFGFASYKFNIIESFVYKPIVYFKSDFVASVVLAP